MATSGSTDYAITRADIIQQVAEKLKIVAVGGTVAAAHTTAISAMLNQFCKVTPGLKIWKTQWVQKTFSAASEVTGTDSNIYTCILGHTSSSDDTPVTGAEYTTYWTQAGSTGGTWATSTAYTSTGEFTDSSSILGIKEAFIRDGSTDHPIEIVNRHRFINISDKATIGIPNILWFNKNTLKIHLWPQLEDTDMVLHYCKRLRVEDFDADANNPDFPIEWANAIVWGVAEDGLSVYDVDRDTQRIIERGARRYMSLALGTDNEEAEVLDIEPDLEGYY